MNTKLVSVITVVYNDVSHIEKTISNVLKQTYPFLEYIVVDGASTDGTLDVIKKYDGKLKYVSEPDKGIYDAMQKGAQLASGEWILFRNCGDFFFSPDAIEKVFNGYVDKGEDFILCNSRYFQDYGYKDMKPNILTKSYFETMPVNHPATFIRRATQLKYPFRLKYRNSADYCFFIEAFLHEATYIYKDVIVALFDNNSGASTDNYDKSISENIDILKTFNAPSNLIKQLEEDLITCRRRKFIKKYIPFFSLYHNYNMKKNGMGKVSFRENFGKYLIMLNFLDFLYGKLPNQGLFWRSIRYGVRIFTNIYANYFIPVCCKNVNVDSNTIIVSLTSFPARINDVWITIASLLNQDYQNMKVVLWLSRVQFPTMAILPKKLLALQSKGLTIHLVEDDMKPHKKYLYSMQMYPQNSIVTVDDDIIYPPKLISQLVLTSLQHKGCVICTKAVTVSKEKYLCWHSCISPDRRLKMIMPIGVGGVLYPPKTFNYSYLFDTDTIKQTCLYGDDLWLNFMCRLNGTEIVKTTYCPGLITIFASQKASLCKVNDNENRNDAQIESISVWAKNKFGIDFYVCK